MRRKRKKTVKKKKRQKEEEERERFIGMNESCQFSLSLCLSVLLER
jgi:hypothetical protein